MDLRIDYAFKLFFTNGDQIHLIRLLNAIFENKQIPRVITDLTIVNPTLDRQSKKDKLTILDIRANLNDGTSIGIEMHRYDLQNHKYKSLRSWARIYGEKIG
jgi:predicted transposase/invertase (TIGR01784 family)